jgi:polyphenol oxidase
MKIIPSIFNDRVIAAQSTREGGVSGPPYNSLNLGKSTDDLPQNVLTNRKLFFGSLNIPIENIALSKQVHGNEILRVNEPRVTEGYDAMITNRPNVFLAVSVADCVPVLIHDHKNNAVAAIHAGWRGSAGEIVFKSLEKMNKEFGSLPGNCFAFIGACIGTQAFEVGDEVAEQFDHEVKQKGNKKFHIDLKAANLRQLKHFGLPEKNIEISNYCTVKHNHLFFSHRHERGITGRMMAVIGIRG